MVHRPQKPVIWVTRPQLNASDTMRKLADLGFNPIAAPLMTYEWQVNTEDKRVCLKNLEVDGFVITSQAVFAAPWDDVSKDKIRSKQIYCVGQKTAKIASEFGCEHIIVGPGNGIALAEMLNKNNAQSTNQKEICYLTGQPRRDSFEKTLSKELFQLHIQEVYQANYVEEMPIAIEKPWQSGEVHIVLLYSPQAANSFMACISKAKHMEHIIKDKRLLICCLSQQVADALKNDRFLVKVAEKADEAHLFALLSQY